MDRQKLKKCFRSMHELSFTGMCIADNNGTEEDLAKIILFLLEELGNIEKIAAHDEPVEKKG